MGVTGDEGQGDNCSRVHRVISRRSLLHPRIVVRLRLHYHEAHVIGVSCRAAQAPFGHVARCFRARVSDEALFTLASIAVVISLRSKSVTQVGYAKGCKKGIFGGNVDHGSFPRYRLDA